MMPQSEIDNHWFEVIAQCPTAVLTKHRISGTLGLWKLEWRDRGDYPPGFEAEAWAAYLENVNRYHEETRLKKMSGDIHTTGVNRRGMFFRLIDNTVLQFTRMLDINCNPTENPDECVVAVYQLPDGEYRGVDLRLFHEDEMQETAN